jgi:hypothetical protein
VYKTSSIEQDLERLLNEEHRKLVKEALKLELAMSSAAALIDYLGV